MAAAGILIHIQEGDVPNALMADLVSLKKI
jgi:hypothetical protein